MQNSKNFNIFTSFQSAVKKYAQQDAIFFEKDNRYQTLTYDSLYNKVINLGNILIETGIKQNDCAAIILENSPHYPIAFMAILYCQAKALPLDYQASNDELTYFLNHSQTKLVLISSSLYNRFKLIIEENGCKTILLDSLSLLNNENPPTPFTKGGLGGFFSPLKGGEGGFLSKSGDEKFSSSFNKEGFSNEPAVIVYTSGTTDVPRGVVLSHKNLLANLAAIRAINILKTGDCLISILPLYHTYPLMVNLLLPLLSGAKISYPPRIEITSILDCSEKTPVTILTAVPRLFEHLEKNILDKLKESPFWFFINGLLSLFLPLRKIKINLAKMVLHNLHKKFGTHLRLLISGGAKLDAETAHNFYKWGFTILEGYGLTETSPVISFNLPNQFKFDTVGKPIPGIELKIDHPDEYGIGEIVVKGDNVMQGYFKDKAATEEKIKNGWLYTQDLGYVDKQGFLHIRGRKKEMLVLSSGKKINPQDLESRYNSRYIKEICIIIPSVCKEKDKLTAVILPDYDYFKSQGVAQIKDKIRWEIETLSHKLAPYKRLKHYIIINEGLPKTSLGKIKRYEVEKKYAGSFKEEEKTEKSISPQDALILSSPICKNTLNYLSKKFKKPVRLDDNFELDLGLDSLEQIELFIEFQQLTGLVLKDEDAFRIFTVRDAIFKLVSVSVQPAEISASGPWKEILTQTPHTSILSSINIKQTVSQKIMSILFYTAIYVLIKLFFLVKVSGKENLPKNGPYIICSNHTSFLDGLIVAGSLWLSPLNKTFFLGYAAYLNHPFLRWGIKPLHLIPIDAASHLVETLESCGLILRNSQILCMFPEGIRSIDGTIQSFKKGVGILAKELNIPIIPAYINGAYEAWPRYKKLPRPKKIEITYGKMLYPEDIIKDNSGYPDMYQVIVDTLREKIINLSKRRFSQM